LDHAKGAHRNHPSRAALIEALLFNGGNVNLASLELMIGRVTLYRKIKELEIQKWEYNGTGIR
jgi:Transcriptional activator of acetoin/glycerol metabolism